MSGLPPILKLIPTRHPRRLEMLYRGHEELWGMINGTSSHVHYLVRWGWLEKHEPVHWLDAYDGYRPTALGLRYLIYEEEHHLIFCRKSKVAELRQRIGDAIHVEFEHTMASFAEELRSAVSKGFVHDPDWKPMPGQKEALARYIRRGFVHIREFQKRHDIGFEELIISGVLRYVQHRNPDTIPDVMVGAKAKGCVMISERWQLTFVRPGMEQALLALCAIDER